MGVSMYFNCTYSINIALIGFKITETHKTISDFKSLLVFTLCKLRLSMSKQHYKVTNVMLSMTSRKHTESYWEQ